MRREQFRDSFLGATLGLAVGDALGAPHQFQSRHQILARHGRLQEMTGGGPLKLEPGEWTDDTAQMLMTLESYVANKGFDGLDITARLVEWFESEPLGLRPETADILNQLAADPDQWGKATRETWYESAGVSSTNSALTRTIVAALIHHHDFPALIEETVRLSQITHFDPRCSDAALAINFLLVQCLNGRFSKDLLTQCWRFLDGLRDDPIYRKTALNYEKHILDTHANVTPMPSFTDDHDAVPRALRHLLTMEYEDLGCSSYVVHTMQSAVWLLMNAESYEDGVARAATLGGDSDTQGAVAGALLGARFGLSGIPDDWLRPLKDRTHLVSLSELLLSQTAVQGS